MKILLADDHAIVRRGLKQLLADSFTGIGIDEVGSGEAVLKKIRSSKYDVIILDISMPGQSGFDTLKQIKSVNENQRVLMLSMHEEEKFAIRLLRAGASGYLTKRTAPEEMVKALRKVLLNRLNQAA